MNEPLDYSVAGLREHFETRWDMLTNDGDNDLSDDVKEIVYNWVQWAFLYSQTLLKL